MRIVEFDPSELSDENRKALRIRLYRQECRAWLLALGLPLIVVLASNSTLADDRWLAQILYSVVAVFLAFWVVYPSQAILAVLRRSGNAE